MSFDLIVRGGRALIEGVGLTECDIAISKGRIAALLQRGEGAAAEVIDARSLHVLPGVIDAHVHFRLGSPDDWRSESRAAAQGGVTTVLSYIQDARSYLQVGAEERARGEAESVVDFGLHFILMNELHLGEIAAYVDRLGVSSFKYFTNFKGQEGAYMGVAGTDAGFFYDLARTVASVEGAMLAVHTENIEIVWRLAAELKAAGADGLRAWERSRPDLVETHDMFTAFLFAERTGCPIYIPHVSSASAVDLYRQHTSRGGRSVIETCAHYLTLTADSELGSIAKVNPPVRYERDMQSLWAAVSGGTIAVVGSDHNSRKRERKEGSIWTASAGFPGVSTLLPLLLDEGVHKRGLPLERVVEVLCSNPARVFGLHPRKGVIAVGADADLVLVDLEDERVVDSSRFDSHADFSPYDGRKLRGWPAITIVRGRVVMREGQITDGSEGHGRYLFRPASGPAASRIAAGSASTPGAVARADA